MITYVGTQLEVNEAYEAESIEQKVHRAMFENEPIEDTADEIFTERKDGVLPAYDIRTDRFDVALDAMSKVAKTYIAEREERMAASQVVEDTKTE